MSPRLFGLVKSLMTRGNLGRETLDLHYSANIHSSMVANPQRSCRAVSSSRNYKCALDKRV